MRPKAVRSTLITGALLILAVVGYLYLAPTRIGGSTTYAVTSGTSMEPRFHAGDLALVRPADQYRVGEIVAYHSAALHVVVLHRIVARYGDRYVFKGDHNNFLDPVQPSRAQLIGKLWLHVPRGGLVLGVLKSPLGAGLLTAVVSALLLFGAKEERRRRKRRRSLPPDPARNTLGLVSIRTQTSKIPVSPTALLAGAAAIGVLFLCLCLIAFSRPTTKPSPRTVGYVQRVNFGYSATAPAGLVYPDGAVKTGDPIFTQLVHRITFDAGYQLATGAPHNLTGTEQIALELVGPSGWSRSFPLGPPMRFAGDQAHGRVTVDLSRVQQLMTKLGRLIGSPIDSSFSFGLVAQLHVNGRIAGQALKSAFSPALGLNFNGVQLQPGANSQTASSGGFGPAGPALGGLTQTKAGTIAMPGEASNRIGPLPVMAVRCIGLLGLLLAAGAAGLALVIKRGEPFEESVRIRARYSHLIVPVVLDQNDLGWPAVDVADIKALVRLAESGQCLILHRPDPGGDTYLVNDAGTVYRYQVKPSNVVWGDWKPTAPRPVGDTEDAAAGEPTADSSTA